MPHPPSVLLAATAVFGSCFSLAGAADWPQQLGPERNGVIDGAALAQTWKDGKLPVLWRANVGFGGAPVVEADARIYSFGLFKPGISATDLSAGASTPNLAEVAAGNFPGGDLPGTPAGLKKADSPLAYRGDLYALCSEGATGRQLWACKLTDAGIAFKTTKHSSTAWELASPLIADGGVYFHSHTGRLFCVNAADGKLRWEVNLFDHGMSTWYGGQQGNSCAPLKAAGNILVSYEDEKGCPAVGAFDAATGAERWVAHAPLIGLNVRTTRLGFATLDAQPTVLCSCGSGTMGLDPATGHTRWIFNLIEANPETMKQVPPAFATPERAARDYKVDAMRKPFPGFAPVSWKNYVIDAACVGHNSVTSAIWCLRISDGKATRLWQTSDFVPQSASLKSPMVARDGRLYGFDSYFPGFIREYVVTRPYRGERIGEFQCRDVATGKLLWSSDAFNPEPPSAKRPDSLDCTFLLAGERIIASNRHGLCLAQLLPDGVKILARGEPGALALADGLLFVRQLTPNPDGAGNLICLDLRRH